mgnify:CR=1 FL=1
MKRDAWVSICLAVVGVVAFGVGNALVLDSGIGHLPGVGLTLVGGALIGLAGAVAFRWQTGDVSRRQTLALVVTFFVSGVCAVGISPFVKAAHGGAMITGVLLPPLVYWIHRADTKTAAFRTDERMQLLAQKAASWVLAAIVLLTAVLGWSQRFGVYSVSAETILAVIGGLGLFGWYGTFRYLQAHN